ncbi:MAG: PD-(D/E)XK nuclease family protein [Candidatus Pelethousia sp.]|nr:PD-(D/E)XK nuclease family protein [Candidatus Pelethousia sp.]
MHLVLGRAGSGKSRFLRASIQDLLNAGAPVAYIVPEQFTFETERQLAEAGISGAPVYSFTTLARRALAEQGDQAVFLSPQGKRMVVRKMAEDLGGSLLSFGRVRQTPGFAASCAQIFTRFKRYEISPAALADAAKALPQADLLGEKLRDLALLYSGTESYLAGRYLDEEDAFAAFCAALPASSFAGRHIVLDGIELRGEQTWRALGILMDIAASLYVSLRLDPLPGRDAPLFRCERRALARLQAMAAERKCAVFTHSLPLPGFAPRQASPRLLHLEREAFAWPFSPFAGADGKDSIRIFAALDRPGECEAAAEAVLAAAQSGMRYRDMAVIAADPAYLDPLARAFRVRGIPFFADALHRLSDYAAPRLLVAALRCISRGFAQNDLLDLIKTGLCGVERDESELFENHILAHGLRGTALTRPFSGKDLPAGAEAARQALVPPLLTLREALAVADTAAKKTEALFAYMEELALYDQLQALTQSLRQAGELELMEENAQVYNDILTVLDQLHAILGESKISTRRYLTVLREGMDAYEIGAIPATVDQVLLGSLDRTRYRDIRALFVLGANEGSFPPDEADDGIVDDDELNRLESMGLNRWETSRERAEAAQMDIYAALAKPKDLLYLSYTMRAGAEAALPAAIIDRVRALFPDIPEESQLFPPPTRSPAGGLWALASGLRAFVDTGIAPPSLPALCCWFTGQPAYRNELSRLETALYPSLSPEPFGYGLALRLYGGAPSGGATRLETYNRCPFRHFVQYGLAAQPRKTFTERRADEGAFCHEALDAFLREASKGDMRHMDEDAVDAILDALLPPILAGHNGGVLLDTARGRAKAARLVLAVKATARAIVRQARFGAFLPGKSEVRFGKGCEYPPLVIALPGGASYALSGRIDRVDGAAIGGASYYRVVDYKSGGAMFDYAQLYHGLKLQLPLYVAALAATESLSSPAGMYYMPIADPVAQEGDTPLSERIQEAFRLRGLTLSDAEVVEATAGHDPANKLIPTGKGAGGLVSSAELSSVVAFAKGKAQSTLSSIMEGDAAVSPARYRKRDACEGCDYRGVCGFDPKAGCKARDLQSLNKAAFFAAISGEEGGHGMDD